MAHPFHVSYAPASKGRASTDSAVADTSRESVRPLCRTTTPRSVPCFHGCENSAETHHTRTTFHTYPDSHRIHRHWPAHPTDQAAEYVPAYAPQADTATHQYRYSSRASPTQRS